eukprot:295792-Pelagomonas_calceolata.AAC.1
MLSQGSTAISGPLTVDGECSMMPLDLDFVLTPWEFKRLVGSLAKMAIVITTQQMNNETEFSRTNRPHTKGRWATLQSFGKVERKSTLTAMLCKQASWRPKYVRQRKKKSEKERMRNERAKCTKHG